MRYDLCCVLGNCFKIEFTLFIADIISQRMQSSVFEIMLIQPGKEIELGVGQVVHMVVTLHAPG